MATSKTPGDDAKEMLHDEEFSSLDPNVAAFVPHLVSYIQTSVVEEERHPVSDERSVGAQREGNRDEIEESGLKPRKPLVQ
jgi:hypothetical protein